MRPVRLSTKYKAFIKALKTDRLQFPLDLNSNLENLPRVALLAKRYQIYFDVVGSEFM